MQVHQVGKPYKHPDKSGFKNRPFDDKIEVKHWSDGFKRCRAEMGISNYDIAHQLGIPQKTVHEWADGDAYPSSVQLSRMYTRLPKLRKFSHLLPAVVRHDPHKDPATGAPVSQEVQVAMIEPDVHVEPPGEFGPFLKATRIQEGMRAKDLAELLDPKVSPSAINNWESGICNPVRVNYDQLCALMPNLRTGPKPALSTQNFKMMPGRRPNSARDVARAFTLPAPTPPPVAPTPVPVPPTPERAPERAPEPPAPPAPVPPSAPPILTVVPSIKPARFSPSITGLVREDGAREDRVAQMNAAAAAYGVAYAAHCLALKDLEEAKTRMDDAIASVNAS